MAFDELSEMDELDEAWARSAFTGPVYSPDYQI